MNNPDSSPPKTILLVDDINESRSIIKLFLSTFGFVVQSFPDAENALAHFNPHIHDLVVTDNSMPGVTGEEMAHILKMRSPSTPILMYSGSGPTNSSCLDLVIRKPASLSVLKDGIDKLLARQH